MRKTLLLIMIVMLTAFMLPAFASAAPDQYVGDTAIYGGAPVVLQPNILVIIDSSGSMADNVPAGAYDPGTPYAVTNHCGGNCIATRVYRTTDGGSSGTLLNNNVNNISLGKDKLPTPDANCPTVNPQDELLTTGQYNGSRLNANGTCNSSSARTYVTGNYINWYHSPQADWTPKITVAKRVIKNLINSTHNVKFGLMKYNANEGGRFLSYSVSGANYVTTVKDMDAIHTGTTTDRQALALTVDSLTTASSTPLGESLFEALRYYSGGASAFSNTIGITAGNYTSPMQFGCQKNYVIVVTDGMANEDDNSVMSVINTTYGRWDGGCTDTTNPDYDYTTCSGTNQDHSIAGVAKYMYEHNLLTNATSTTENNVTTYTIGFGDIGGDKESVDLLTLAADKNHGRGKYYDAGSETALSAALISIVAEILDVNTSFVAPVVPVSPENRTYAGTRVYMGFFKPESTKMWSGNLKKFGLGCDCHTDPHCPACNPSSAQQDLNTNADFGNSNVLDADSYYATYIITSITPTTTTPYHDSRDNVTFPGTATNGSFRASARSYWSTSADGGEVEAGGAGEVLFNRAFTLGCATCDIAGDKRNIYTYMGTTNKGLIHGDNAFSTTNALITAASLSLPGPIITSGTNDDKNKLINFIHGFDIYGASPTDKRNWILGDVLHAKPVPVSYATYTFSVSNEANCSMNKTMIYVGSNDGMMHAFRDCDGSEAWAFIPKDLFPDLQYLKGAVHSYFMDSTIVPYIFDANKNGIIDLPGDKVILIMGLRRGGGKDTEPTKGFYYALDVSDPEAPTYMWKISNETAVGGISISDMGETWGEPKIGKIKINSQEKIVMFLGGGYDNCNEDARYGATQAFSGSCVNAVATLDGGLSGGFPITSTGATAVSTFTSALYKGRAIYIVELATLNSNVPDFTLSGNNLIWSWRKENILNSPAFEFSMLSEMTVLDTDYDGYADRLYMGDSGGNMWRINIKDATNTNNWTVAKIFSSNPGADGTVGRKIFYKPSAFIDVNDNVRLYFGTGDREHPLNRSVTDRMYGLIDKGQTTADAVTEAKLLDLTADLIQNGTGGEYMSITSDLKTADNPGDTTLYGWYIKLDAGDRTPAESYPGEKILAAATVTNGAVYFTTYQPTITTTVVDPCSLGNLGTARLYAVDYWDAGSIIDNDLSNNSLYNTYKNNSNATRGTSDKVFLRSDRPTVLGSGIPSGIVSTPPTLLVGCGGGVCQKAAKTGGEVRPLFWRQNTGAN